MTYNVDRFLNDEPVTPYQQSRFGNDEPDQGVNIFQSFTKKSKNQSDVNQTYNSSRRENSSMRKQQTHDHRVVLEEAVYSSPPKVSPRMMPHSISSRKYVRNQSPEERNPSIAKKPSMTTRQNSYQNQQSSSIYSENLNEPPENYDYDSSTQKPPVEKLIGSRILKLILSPNFCGYGCELIFDEVNNVVLVNSILPNSPALQAGLKQDDLLLRINNESLTGKGFAEIVNLFSNRTIVESESDQEVLKLEVIEKNLYLPDSLTTRNETNFKRCKIELPRGTSSFGLSLVDQNVKPKHSIIDVEVDSPAWRVNLRKKDVIIEIDGQNIRRNSPSEVIKKIGECSYKGGMEILAISSEGYKHYKLRKWNFSSKKLLNSSLDYRVEDYKSKEQQKCKV